MDMNFKRTNTEEEFKKNLFPKKLKLTGKECKSTFVSYDHRSSYSYRSIYEIKIDNTEFLWNAWYDKKNDYYFSKSPYTYKDLFKFINIPHIIDEMLGIIKVEGKYVQK